MSNNVINFTVTMNGNAVPVAIELNDSIQNVVQSVRSASTTLEDLGKKAFNLDSITNVVNKVSQAFQSLGLIRVETSHLFHILPFSSMESVRTPFSIMSRMVIVSSDLSAIKTDLLICSIIFRFWCCIFQNCCIFANHKSNLASYPLLTGKATVKLLLF